MVEDSESDAALIVRQLQKANYIVEFERVETPDRMEAALADRSWDFIFSDYTHASIRRVFGVEDCFRKRGRIFHL